VLFAGGGNLLSFIPDDEAMMGRLERKVKQEIKEISKNGLQVAVVCFSEPLSTIPGNFDEVLAKSQDFLEDKKNEAHFRKIHTDPGKICDHCFKRPARNGGFCEVCKTKEGTGRQQRSQTSKKFIKNTYGLPLPIQVSHVGDSIAMLAIDRNMMGRMFQQTTTPAEYTYKSKTFDSEFEMILKDTIRDFLENEKKRKLVIQRAEGIDYLGIDVLYAGGDDILMIMNARGAIQFSQMLVNNIAERFAFEKTFYNGTVFKNNIVTVSCGIAIADCKFPIYFLLEAARDMETMAKEKFRKRTPPDEFGIIHLPKGSIAVTAISSAMPGNDSYCYVLDDASERLDIENLDKLRFCQN
jgi:hypothetical protein